jgi:hypothetical protein
LKRRSVDTIDLFELPDENRELMLFKGDESFIRCLAHVLNLVAKSMLKVFNAGFHKEAKKIIKQMRAEDRDSFQASETP